MHSQSSNFLLVCFHDYKIITRLCNRVPSLQGVAITIATAAIGISAAHLVIREFMARYMKT
jgi:hypothetical protein